MLEMLGEEQIRLTAIDRLNELREAERAGWTREKAMSEPTLAARLRFLNRGQGWVGEA
jgi:hypothetical protein